MTDLTLTLSEFGTCNIRLTPADYLTLKARYRGKLSFVPTEEQNIYALTAQDYVGRVALSEGRVLRIEPKVTVANLFYMLCVEAGVVSFYPKTVTLSEHSDVFTVILARIVTEISHLVARGLLQNYVEVERDLPLVKGRIALSAQVRLHGDLKHRHVCRFAEPTHDTAENRILAATLRYSAPLLQLTGEHAIFRQVRALLQHFEGISPTTGVAALQQYAYLRKHRLNRAYWPLLGLCALVLRGISLTEAGGPHRFDSFLVDMPRLFESFMTARLAAALPAYGLIAVAQRHDYLDTERQVGIRPDILVYGTEQRRPLLVLDAKYRQPKSPRDDLNRDLYQVSAYMHRYNLSRGLIVYPQWEKPGPASITLLGATRELYIASLDLSAPNLAALDLECAKLAAQVAALSK